jgi:hypothetical protein
MLTMRRRGDRNVVARNRVEHGLQLNQPVGCSKVQRCERADHLQSTMPSYSHSLSFVHQQKDGLEDIAWCSPATKAISPFPESSLTSPPPGNRVSVPKFPICHANRELVGFCSVRRVESEFGF